MLKGTFPRISLIAAIAKNRTIGINNELPWHIPEDVKRFRRLTKGHVVVMGRKTFQSIGRALPERTNIVITRDPDFATEGCIVVHSIEAALKRAKELEREEVFVIGGGEIYKAALPYADKLYLTIIDKDFAGDAFFPEYPEFRKVVFEGVGEWEGLRYRFVDLEKKVMYGKVARV
ncbi:MAG: dihydrofolate reductase [Patescibacteria group bacterium]|nr:dihydrofolate reductase [Patescibacteria group bacterium]